jgi:hypothetical protein
MTHYLDQCKQKGKEISMGNIDNNLISRRAVLDMIQMRMGGKELYKAVYDLPPVNPQPKYEDIVKAFQFGLAFGFGEKYDEMDEVIDKIKKVITPQLKTARWISDAIQGEIDGQIVKAFICSECGAISVFRITDGKIVNGDLCPNCGAKMIEPQESEAESEGEE